MESANTHHHPQDHQLVTSSSSSCYGVGTTATNAWTTPISILNTNGLSSYPTPENNLSSQYASMAPDSSNFHWLASNNTTLSGQDLQIYSRIKEQQLSDHFYRGYTELLTSNPPQNDLNTRLLLKSLSSGNLTNKINQLSTGDLYSGSQIFPSINISNLNQPGEGLTNPAGSLDMNLEALDLLACSRFSGNFGQNQSGIFRDGVSYGSFDQIPLYGSNKVTGSSNGVVVEAKRTSSKMEPKAPLQNAPKKSRLEARASCPPFKVRKEKLGDRIAALQQLVAPFGKTDTASVLMEAIGYIKFLQSQVETLSVPYMKASRNKSTTRVLKGGPTHDHETEESKRDLKSRGLCLVPLSCLSYITDGGGAAVWPPPHFGGAP